MRAKSAKLYQFPEAPDRAPVSVGDAVSFVPSAFTDFAPRETLRAAYTLNGRVIYVNAPHRYYVAEAELYGYTLREAYKF